MQIAMTVRRTPRVSAELLCRVERLDAWVGLEG
jgi:hypothetical protein